MTYAEVGTRLGITVCPGAYLEPCGVLPDRHRIGRAKLGVIHWAPRRVTKPGLWRFLALAARAQDPNIDALWSWLRSYRVNQQRLGLARQLGIRFPKRYADHERAIARYHMDQTPERERRGYTEEVQEQWQKAQRWATG